MGVLASLLLAMIITLVALALAIVFIVTLVVAVGSLGTKLERAFKSRRLRKESRLRKADIITLVPRATRASEPQKHVNNAGRS